MLIFEFSLLSYLGSLFVPFCCYKEVVSSSLNFILNLHNKNLLISNSEYFPCWHILPCHRVNNSILVIIIIIIIGTASRITAVMMIPATFGRHFKYCVRYTLGTLVANVTNRIHTRFSKSNVYWKDISIEWNVHDCEELN